MPFNHTQFIQNLALVEDKLGLGEVSRGGMCWGLSINLIEQFTKNRERDYLEIINYISELAPEILNQYVDEFNRNPEMTVDIPLLFENKTISKNIPFKKIINIIKKINNEQNNLSNKRKWVSFATYTCRIRTTEELANILQQCDYFFKTSMITTVLDHAFALIGHRQAHLWFEPNKEIPLEPVKKWEEVSSAILVQYPQRPFIFSLDMVRKPSFDDQFDQVLAELSQALEQHNNSQDRGLKTKIKFFYQQIAQYKDGKISRDTLIENITFMSQPIQNQAVKVVIDSFTKKLKNLLPSDAKFMWIKEKSYEFDDLSEPMLLIARVKLQVALIYHFLSQGMSPNMTGYEGIQVVPLSNYRDLGHLEIDKMLDDFDDCYPQEERLIFPAKKGYTQPTALLVNYDLDLDKFDSDSSAALHYAAKKQTYGNVWFLLFYGADPNLMDGQGMTPLHHALTAKYDEAKKYQIVELLLQFNANPNLPDKQGKTAWEYAGDDEKIKTLLACYGAKGAENFQIPGHLENQLEINHFIYNYLICGKDSAALKEEDIKRFAEIKVFEATKQCLVHLMGFYGNSVLLQRLEKFPELLEQKDFFKNTVLSIACLRKNYALALSLAGKGFKVNQPAIFYTLKNGDFTEAKKLIGFNFVIKPSLWDSIFSFLKPNAQNEAIQLLLPLKFDAKYLDKNGETLLHHAAKSYATQIGEAIQSFIGQGADVNQRDYNGASPCLTATKKRNIKAARAFLNAGADPNQADYFGMTPLRLAVGMNQTDMVEILLRNGATFTHAEGIEFLNLIFKQSFRDRTIAKLLVAHWGLTKPITKNMLDLVYLAYNFGLVEPLERLLFFKKYNENDAHLPLTYLLSENDFYISNGLKIIRDVFLCGNNKHDFYGKFHYPNSYKTFALKRLTDKIKKIDDKEKELLTAIYKQIEAATSLAGLKQSLTGSFMQFAKTIDQNESLFYGFDMTSEMRDLFVPLQEMTQRLADGPKDPYLLHWAINSGFVDVMEDLLLKGANTESPDNRGNKPFQLAINQNNPTVLRCLIAHQVDLSQGCQQPQEPSKLAPYVELIVSLTNSSTSADSAQPWNEKITVAENLMNSIMSKKENDIFYPLSEETLAIETMLKKIETNKPSSDLKTFQRLLLLELADQTDELLQKTKFTAQIQRVYEVLQVKLASALTPTLEF